MNPEKITKAIGVVADSAASILKVILQSGKASPKNDEKKNPVVVMGNGPSLRTAIDNNMPWLKSHDLLAVNFAANTPEFQELRPRYYVLADGHFFTGSASDPNVKKLWNALASTAWEMTLWVPRRYAAVARHNIEGNGNVTVKVFNLTPIEGAKSLCHKLMDAGLGMPRPRNVMIPAIMAAIREGYRKIILIGADHTWTQTLSVDDENFVVSVQPHFYKDNDEEHRRVRSTYAGLHLHDVLGSMTIAFRSYWHIADYARSRGIEIVNATPGSMIDAFPRMNL